ncbi:hypothetical protein ADUPG1_005199, partial [Aduncisulcus paluster]
KKKDGELKVLNDTVNLNVQKKVSLMAGKGFKGIEVDAIVDSGASHCVVSEDIVKRLEGIGLSKCDVMFRLANGDQIRSEQRARLIVKIEGSLGKPLQYSTWFYVIKMKSGTTPVLLGRDFIEDTRWLQKESTQMVRDVEEDELRFGDVLDILPKMPEEEDL